MLKSTVAFVFLASCLGTTSTDTAVSVEVQQESLKLIASLPKETYLWGEPIIVTLKLVNESQTNRRLAEPGHHTTACIVTAAPGSGPLPPQIESATVAPPRDYGWVLLPGEARQTQQDVLGKFSPAALPSGHYYLTGVYTGPPEVENVWHGTIRTPPLEFVVVAPEGSMLEKAERFVEAREQSGTKARAHCAADVLRALSYDPEAGEFAKYAGFFEAYAYSGSGYRSAYLARMKRYAQENAAVPCYGQAALERAAIALYRDKDYSAARDYFDKLPDGYERRTWLRKCDEKLAE